MKIKLLKLVKGIPDARAISTKAEHEGRHRILIVINALDEHGFPSTVVHLSASKREALDFANRIIADASALPDEEG